MPCLCRGEQKGEREKNHVVRGSKKGTAIIIIMRSNLGWEALSKQIFLGSKTKE